MTDRKLFFITQRVAEGNVGVYPTDTLYALGADIYNEDAVKRVFLIKHRPLSEPLPTAVASKEDIQEAASLDEKAERLIDVFLPGPLTIILEKKDVPDVVTANLPGFALRISRNQKALQLLAATGPLTVTSANIHGKRVPSTVNGIKKQLHTKFVAAYIDDGALHGKPSTIVDFTKEKPIVLREGLYQRIR
ncbi:MAG TPA: threonylcarbamoyl-AMP synthase [Thermoplasmata archaeon]|nr:threonylcarbamoyl-AMP synthase [Thermoplasmata archaeon]